MWATRKSRHTHTHTRMTLVLAAVTRPARAATMRHVPESSKRPSRRMHGTLVREVCMTSQSSVVQLGRDSLQAHSSFFFFPSSSPFASKALCGPQLFTLVDANLLDHVCGSAVFFCCLLFSKYRHDDFACFRMTDIVWAQNRKKRRCRLMLILFSFLSSSFLLATCQPSNRAEL